MELLYSKFIAAAHRHGLPKRFAQLGRVSMAAVGILGTLTASLVGFLVGSANTSEKEDNSAEGDLTGVYNFRTRKFDNGTDPYGWYEEDL